MFLESKAVTQPFSMYICAHVPACVESLIDPFLAAGSFHGNWVG